MGLNEAFASLNKQLTNSISFENPILTLDEDIIFLALKVKGDELKIKIIVSQDILESLIEENLDPEALAYKLLALAVNRNEFGVITDENTASLPFSLLEISSQNFNSPGEIHSSLDFETDQSCPLPNIKKFEFLRFGQILRHAFRKHMNNSNLVQLGGDRRVNMQVASFLLNIYFALLRLSFYLSHTETDKNFEITLYCLDERLNLRIPKQRLRGDRFDLDLKRIAKTIKERLKQAICVNMRNMPYLKAVYLCMIENLLKNFIRL